MALRKAAKTAEKVADKNSFATIANQRFEDWKFVGDVFGCLLSHRCARFADVGEGHGFFDQA